MTGQLASVAFDVGASITLIRDAHRDPRARIPDDIRHALTRLERAQSAINAILLDSPSTPEHTP